MAEPLIYVDVSDVHEGLLGDLKDAITGLAEFIEENEPQLLSYNAYFSDDGTHMSVVHVHADPPSLDRHLEIAGPRFARFAELVTLRSIHIYGRPSENALRQLRDKLKLLGSGDVVVYPPHAGFVRSGCGTGAEPASVSAASQVDTIVPTRARRVGLSPTDGGAE